MACSGYRAGAIRLAEEGRLRAVTGSVLSDLAGDGLNPAAKPRRVPAREVGVHAHAKRSTGKPQPSVCVNYY
jgi:hypothetical protein